MGILRSQTTHPLSSHFHKPSFTSSPRESTQAPPTSSPEDPIPGINRANTDPLALNKPPPHASSASSSTHKTTPPTSRPSSRPTSGTSSPQRKQSSLDIVRKIRDRPTSAIPGYYHVAEEIHKYKMRNCHGMSCTEEETAGIDKMKKWNWKHAGHPGDAVFPVGPKDEEYKLEGVALEQITSKVKRHNSN